MIIKFEPHWLLAAIWEVTIINGANGEYRNFSWEIETIGL